MTDSTKQMEIPPEDQLEGLKEFITGPAKKLETLTDPKEQLEELCKIIKENLVGNPVVAPENAALWAAHYFLAVNLVDTERFNEIAELRRLLQAAQQHISVLETQLRSDKVIVEVAREDGGT